LGLLGSGWLSTKQKAEIPSNKPNEPQEPKELNKPDDPMNLAAGSHRLTAAESE
jgi:hypothetical protein